MKDQTKLSRSKASGKIRKDGGKRYDPAFKFFLRVVQPAYEGIKQSMSKTGLSANSTFSLLADMYLHDLPESKVKRITVEYEDGTVAVHKGDNNKTISNFKK